MPNELPKPEPYAAEPEAGGELAAPTLLACPFCGGDSEYKMSGRGGWNARRKIFVNSCGVYPATLDFRTKQGCRCVESQAR